MYRPGERDADNKDATSMSSWLLREEQIRVAVVLGGSVKMEGAGDAAQLQSS